MPQISKPRLDIEEGDRLMILRQAQGSKGPYEVDGVRYNQVSVRALDDIASVLAEELQKHPKRNHHSEYQRVVNPDVNLQIGAFGARRVKQLVRRICARFEFTVEFVAVRLATYGLPDEFISWIMANLEGRKLTILYDVSKLARSAASAFEREKGLAKILLHECAHAVLHRGVIEDMLAARPEDMLPSLQPEHEQDAWLYAGVVWSVMVGDHAYWTRVSSSSDLGWTLA
jgi:hypothetical protein